MTKHESLDWSSLPGAPALLGESPFWHPLEERLYWVDIAGRAVLRWREGDGVPERWEMPAEPGCIAPARLRGGSAAGLVVMLRDRVCHAPRWGGGLRELTRLPIDAVTQRANDGKCDALGRFWVGTVHEPVSGPRQPVAALYCVDLRQPDAPLVRRVLDGVATANGLAWAPDGRTLYWADTPAHVIRAWDVDAQGEPMGVPRVFHRFDAKPQGWTPGDAGYAGRPDGACVDAEGRYWCAMYEGGRVLCLSPAGEVIRQLPVPVQCPTMPCAVDGRLFVTSASHGRPQEELARLPSSGRVLTQALDVRSLPVAWCEVGAAA